MRCGLWHVVCFVACISVMVVSDTDDDGFTVDEDNVYILHDNDFDDFMKKHPTALVEFYAPWCGHCKTLQPEYQAAARTLKVNKQPVALAKVDATAEVDLAKKHKIEGFPTLKWWKDGEGPSEYDGGRDHASIVTWIRQRIDPTYKPPPSPVLALTKETFESYIADKDIVLVEFYAPWCGHCKKLEPEYERAARTLKNRDPPIHLAKVDATVEKDLAQEYGVSGYPTLKIFRRGRRFDYDGPREADGIIKYMIEQARPAAQHLGSSKEARNFMHRDDVTVIGFFAAEDTRLFQSFVDAADSLRSDFRFGYSLEPEVLDYFKAKPNQVRVFFPKNWQSKYEQSYTQFDNFDASKEDVIAFVEKNCVPLVGHRRRDNLKRYKDLMPLVVVYYAVDFSHEHVKGTQYWRERVLKVANAHKDKSYKFAISNEEEFADELKAAGIDDSGMDVNVIVYGVDGKRYPWNPEKFDEDEFNAETFSKFMKHISTNRIRPYVKSQPAPKEDKALVKTVVAATFDQIVGDESKDVLIEFYAPWCGHCKKLEPVYEQMAKKLSKDQKLVIAKMDATANDSVDKYAVEGFPTIYFAPSGQKQNPVKYTGDRSEQSMIEFMKEHAVVSFKDEKTEL